MGLASSLLAGCFQPPVTERLELGFGPEGGVTVELTIEHTRPMFGNPDLDARLDEEERILLEGWSPWEARFAALAVPESEGLAWEKARGQLKRYRRWVHLEDPGRLVDFFADTPIYADYQEDDQLAQLALYPGGTRATAADVRRIEAALEAWSPVVADYLGAASELWWYLESHPGRARATLGPLFEDLVDDSVRIPAPGPNEEPLVQRLATAMEEVIDIFDAPPDEIRTLEEISRQVYDPFPARIVVEVPASVLEVEGFVAGGGEGQWTVAGLSFWASFAGLEGDFLTPDPLVAIVRHLSGPDDLPFDLDGYLARPFRAHPEAPDEAAVRLALDQRLRPAPAYRLVWRLVEDRSPQPLQ